MIPNLLTFRCPHCRTPVEVDTDIGDEILVCPSATCGKPFRAEVPVAEPIIGRAPLGTKPAATAATVADQEKELERIRLATFRRFPFRWLMYVLLGVAGMTSLAYGIIVGPSLWVVTGGLALAFSLGRLGLWWMRMRNTYLTLTSKRCLVTTGTLSEQVSEVMLDHVRDVSVSQDWLARLLRVGDVVLSSENGERTQVVMMGVPHPERLAERLRAKA